MRQNRLKGVTARVMSASNESLLGSVTGKGDESQKSSSPPPCPQLAPAAEGSREPKTKRRERRTVFEFRHFTVDDAGSAMKIGTDGILLGLFAGFTHRRGHCQRQGERSEEGVVSAAILRSPAALPARPIRVLDVGVGCGVAGLLAVQGIAAAAGPLAAVQVLGVDIDPAACTQAATNLAAAIARNWPDGRVTFSSVVHDVSSDSSGADAVAWAGDGGFDFIVCNPPFFGSLRQWRAKAARRAPTAETAEQQQQQQQQQQRRQQGDSTARRDQARMVDSLPPRAVAAVVRTLLRPAADERGSGGGAFVVYPTSVADEFLHCVREQNKGAPSPLKLVHRVSVFDNEQDLLAASPRPTPIRSLLWLQLCGEAAQKDCYATATHGELCIYQSRATRVYSDRYKADVQRVMEYSK